MLCKYEHILVTTKVNNVIVLDIDIIAVVEGLTMKASYQSVQESHIATGGTDIVPMETNVTLVLSKISTTDIDTRDPADTGEAAKLQNQRS
jgi:hypothetical protein